MFNNIISENEEVASALKQTAKTLNWIGDEHEKLAKKSLDPLLDALYSYKGMLACIPDIVNVHRVSNTKFIGKIKGPESNIIILSHFVNFFAR